MYIITLTAKNLNLRSQRRTCYCCGCQYSKCHCSCCGCDKP